MLLSANIIYRDRNRFSVELHNFYLSERLLSWYERVRTMLPNVGVILRILLVLPIGVWSFMTVRTSIPPTTTHSNSNPHHSSHTINNNINNYNRHTLHRAQLYHSHGLFASSSSSSSSSSTTTTTTSNSPEKERRMLYPAVGDIVRYYDLDGGNQKGQMMIGKISYISKNMGKEKSGWTVEIIELDRLRNDSSASSTNSNGGVGSTSSGGSYYADYPNYQTRKSKTILRDLHNNVSPVACVFVNSENAYKISINTSTQQPIVRQEQYDLEGYEGPFVTNLPYSSNIRPINDNIVLDDAVRYDLLKFELLRNTALFGIVGAIVTYIASSTMNGSDPNSKNGIEYALIYFSGVLANLLYLYFLSMKTDTMATTSTNNKFGKVITNLRFITPILPLIAVSIYNELVPHPEFQSTTFKLVSTQQFFAVTIGFLSYRIPLFFTQIQESLKDNNTSNKDALSTTTSTIYQPTDTSTSTSSGTVTPGKVSLVSSMDTSTTTTTTTDTKQSTMKPLFPIKFNTKTKKNELVTIFLISGPSATGRSELVQRFVQESNGQFVLPKYIDRLNNVTQFEYIDQRNGFIYKSNEDRYGFTRESLVQDVQNLDPTKSVMILDADVDFAIQLSQMGGGVRLVAVWVTLGSIDAFEERIGRQYDQQTKRITDIMPDEGRNIEIRARTMKIVQEIELGISSGIFEFTIINDNEEQSLKELREASKYCFV